MAQKFNTEEYKPLEELFPDGKFYSFIELLDPERSICRVTKGGILLLGKENGPNLESIIKVGNGNLEQDNGETIRITGFVKYKGIIEDGYLKYQFDIFPDSNFKEDYVRSFVTKRDEIRSLMLYQEIGSNSINLNQYETSNLKNNISTKHNNSKTDIQGIPMTIYGTVQDNGGIYIEIDAVKVGKNPIVYHNKKNKIGFLNR